MSTIKIGNVEFTYIDKGTSAKKVKYFNGIDGYETKNVTSAELILDSNATAVIKAHSTETNDNNKIPSSIEGLYTSHSLLGLFGVIESEAQIMIQDGRDIQVDNLKYTSILDTFGMNNGFTFQMQKAEIDTKASDFVRRRGTFVSDYLINADSFYRESGYTNPTPTSNFNILSKHITKQTSINKFGFGDLYSEDNVQFLGQDFTTGEKKQHIVIKVYKESVLKTLSRTTDRPHILVCRDGAIKVLRAFSEDVSADDIFPNNTSGIPWLNSNFLLIGFEGYNPIDFSVSHYEFENKLNALLLELNHSREELRKYENSGSAVDNINIENTQLTINQYISTINDLVATFVPDYGTAFEYTQNETVSLLHKRNDNVQIKQSLIFALNQDEDLNAIPFNKLNKEHFFTSIERINDQFTPFKPIPLPYTQQVEVGNWYNDNNSFLIDDYNLLSIYGDQSNVALFDEEIEDVDNEVRYLKNRVTKWDVLSKYSSLVNDKGHDLYFIMESLQSYDYLIAKHSSKAQQLYNDSQKVESDVTVAIPKFVEDTVKFESISNKDVDGFTLDANYVSARTVFDLYNWWGATSNYISSKKTALNIGLRSSFPLQLTKTNDRYDAIIDGIVSIVPEWERHTINWIAKRYSDPLFSYKYLYGNELKKKLTLSIFRDEILPTTEQGFDPFPDDIPLDNHQGDGRLTRFAPPYYIINDDVFKDYYTPSQGNTYYTKGFKTAMEEVVSSGSISDSDSEFSFTDFYSRQSEVTKDTNYLMTEGWKVTNPVTTEFKTVFANIRKWSMNIFTEEYGNEFGFKAESKKQTIDIHRVLFKSTEVDYNKKIKNFTSINDIKKRVSLTASDIVDKFISNGEVNKTFLEKVISNFTDLKMDNADFSNTGVALKFNKSDDMSAVVYNGRKYDVIDKQGYLSLHLLAPIFGKYGSNLGSQMKRRNTVNKMVRGRDILQYPNECDPFALLSYQYERMMYFDEDVRSAWTSPSYFANIYSPSKGVYKFPTFRRLYGSEKTDIVNNRFRRKVTPSKDYEFNPMSIHNTFAFNEDPYPLIFEAMINVNASDEHHEKYTGFKQQKVGTLSDRRLLFDYDNQIRVEDKVQYLRRASYYGGTLLQGDYKTVGDDANVYYVIPFRSSFSPRGYRIKDELKRDSEYYASNYVVNSPMMKAFYGGNGQFTNEEGLTMNFVNPHKPIYISKMPKEYCISEVVRDSIYDYVSNTLGTYSLGLDDDYATELDYESISKIMIRNVKIYLDYFRYMFEDFAFELSRLPHRLAQGLFGDQVLGGKMISEYNQEDDAVNTFLTYLDEYAHIRMSQEASQGFTSDNDYQGFEDNIFEVSSDSDMKADIAFFINKVVAMYETLLELKNSSLHVNTNSDDAVSTVGSSDDYEHVTSEDIAKSLVNSFTDFNNLDIDFDNVKNYESDITSSPKLLFGTVGNSSRLESQSVVAKLITHQPFSKWNDVYLKSVHHICPRFSKNNPTTFLHDDHSFPFYYHTFFGRGLIEINGIYQIRAKLGVLSDWNKKFNDPDDIIYGWAFGAQDLIGLNICDQWDDTVNNYQAHWNLDIASIVTNGSTKDRITDAIYYNLGAINEIINNTRNPITVANSEINSYAHHNDYIYLNNGIKYQYALGYNNTLTNLGYLSGSYSETTKIQDGVEFIPLKFVDIIKDEEKAKLIILHSEQVRIWSDKKKKLVDEFTNFIHNSRPLVSTLGMDNYYRGYRAFVEPTTPQTDAFQAVLRNLSCEITNMRFGGNPYSYISPSIQRTYKKNTKGLIITTNQLSDSCTDFNPTWDKLFSQWGYDYEVSRNYEDIGILPQHHAQVMSLISPTNDILDGIPSYYPFYGVYTKEDCGSASYAVTTEGLFNEKTSTDANCSTANLGKYFNSNDFLRTINWDGVFNETNIFKPTDEVYHFNINYPFSDEFKYKDTINTNGQLRTTAQLSMRGAIEEDI